MSAKQGRKIAIVGATGNIGLPTLTSLLEYGIHTVTAISRPDSKATFPAGVQVVKGSYDDEAFLLSALAGQDVLVLQLNYYGEKYQANFIKAAAKAGVRYVLPTEFGSDPYARLVQESPFLSSKKQYRDLAEEVGVSWIAIVNNPWYAPFWR